MTATIGAMSQIDPAKPDAPLLSILLSTRDRARSLERALRSLTTQTLPHSTWEVHVVDNGSSDDTPAVLQHFESELPLIHTRFDTPGKNRALNSVLNALRGRFTVLTDDDIDAPPNWLDNWRKGFARWPDQSVFAGGVIPRFPPGTAEWLTHDNVPFRTQMFAAFRPVQAEGPYNGTPCGPNFALDTTLLRATRFRDDLGPAPRRYAMGGETEFGMRLQQKGHAVIYLPEVVVDHCLLAENLTDARLMARARNAGAGDEYRRMLRRDASRFSLQRRLHVSLPLKIGYYRLRCLIGPLLSSRQQFRHRYKLSSALGRRDLIKDQLHTQPTPSGQEPT